ncbi:Family S53 protease-like protein [Mycena venus]|uniref:tripeptidyl-peptidase II n=1 Tax=Mycena venus TaxID=2733690 RepID=A0A8H6YW05_9AGAR|nr:Family S53 protease-like protein [Mycena venus]
MTFNKLANFLTLISAVSGGLVLHESRSAAPAGFISQGTAPVTDLLTLRFGLTPNNLSGLQEKLVSISTPGNSDFRQWLSKDEVKSFVQPSNETVAVFNSFAAANGLKPTVISPNGDWLSLTLAVSQANQLFGAQFEKFSHASLTEPITRTLTISLPSELIGHVDVIHPSTSFTGRNPGFARVPFHPHSFEKRTEPVASCLATGVPIDFLSVGGPPNSNASDLATALLDTNTFIDGVDHPPSVVTTSYGSTENQFESSVAKKICDNYMALGARGISILFASGDGGVRGGHDNSSIPGVCESNVFIPIFPASCPYVTAIGATQGFNPEVATNLTGGGFSDVFQRPWYQTQAVDSFLKTIPPNFAGKFNKSGRGYPDVAVQGLSLDVVFEGKTSTNGGTSFSSPIFASIVALINDRLLAAGKPVLGFLNPWLYANAKRFTDITEGHNSGFECPTSSAAFDATKGWDALTGIGSPVFDKLLASAFEY